MDSEDEDYVPTELQRNIEYEKLTEDSMTEQKEPWDRVWAYCADCGERGDVYLRCKMCYGDELNNGSSYLSQEEDHSGWEEHCEE